MNITILPVTRSSKDIKDNFLKKLSQWVDIKENPIKEDVQILIFKPTGLPKEEFYHLINVFKDTGGRLDDVKIFITATKPDRVKFQVPEKYNFAHQTCVFLNDENEIDPRSSDAMKETADFLIHSCGFQPYLHETSRLDIRPGTTELKSKASEQRTLGNKKNSHPIALEEKQEEKNDLHTGNTCLKRTESRGDHSCPVMRIKVQSARIPFLGPFSGYKEVTYDVSLYAVEDEIMNIEEGRYNFQRKNEKIFHLEPGTLQKVLEFIREELKNLPSYFVIVEGQNFENLERQVNEKFGLPGDRLKELLKEIFKRNDKAGKGWPTSTSDENMAFRTQVEAYQACGDT